MTINEREYKRIEAAIEAAIDAATWAPFPAPPGPGCASYEGQGNGWRLLVVSFSIEDQGFPPGSLGYDGSATFPAQALVVRLTRPQAKRAFERAEKQAHGTN